MTTTLRSMTGYGRGESTRGDLRVVVELRAVNHRFLDLSFRLPRVWLGLEPSLSKRLKTRLGRGRVEVYVKRDGTADVVPKLDLSLVQGIREEIERAGAALDLESNVQLSDLLRIPGVLNLVETEVDVDNDDAQVLEALDGAIDALIVMRSAEGTRLGADLVQHLGHLRNHLLAVESESNGIPKALSERLRTRVSELVESVDEERLAQEAALLVDKAGIDEEIGRLRSHLDQAEALLRDPEPVGRRLDFLVQELHREANTIGSKAGTVGLSALCVDLKSTIEKVREQVANFE